MCSVSICAEALDLRPPGHRGDLVVLQQDRARPRPHLNSYSSTHNAISYIHNVYYIQTAYANVIMFILHTSI